MSKIGLEIAVRPHRALRWAAIIGGVGIAVVIGLLSAESFFFAANDVKTGVSATQPVSAQAVAVPEPVSFAIVPAAAIETKPQFFFGTGDGSAGYYSERPIQ